MPRPITITLNANGTEIIMGLNLIDERFYACRFGEDTNSQAQAYALINYLKEKGIQPKITQDKGSVSYNSRVEVAADAMDALLSPPKPEQPSQSKQPAEDVRKAWKIFTIDGESREIPPPDGKGRKR